MAETLAARLRGLYAITPDDPDTDALIARVDAALRGRPALLQYRNKAASPALQRRQAQALAGRCRAQAVPLIINDDIQQAKTVGAAGVHLGRDDGDLAAARALLGTDAIIGITCYGDLERARAAQHGGASYVAFGSVYPSPSKPRAPRVSLDVLHEAASTLHIPVCAIGGICRDNAAPLVAAGVDLLAVINDLFGDDDPAAAAIAFARLFEPPPV